MLPKSQRLLTKQFDEVMKKGRVVRTQFFVVRILFGFDRTKVVGVTPQKLAKTAVARHRSTRRIYQAAQMIINQFPAGTHAIIIARKNIDKTPISQLATDLKAVYS